MSGSTRVSAYAARRAPSASPYRFRDTLAVEMLQKGTPMDRVCGQAQLETDLMQVWRDDPPAQVALLRSDIFATRQGRGR